MAWSKAQVRGQPLSDREGYSLAHGWSFVGGAKDRHLAKQGFEALAGK